MALNKFKTKSEALLEADSMKSVRAIVGLMDELSQIMQGEAELLDQHNYVEHKELLKRKQRLTLEYRTTMKTFISQPDLLKAMPSEVRAAVRESAQKLSDITERNARTLRAAVVAVQKMLQSVMKIIKSEVLPNPSYRNHKTQHLNLGTYSPTCKPVAISRMA